MCSSDLAAPFDAILMAAAAVEVPAALREQLGVGGRMVLPIGTENRKQHLCLIERTAQGFRETVLDEVKFVPLRHGVS